MVLRVEVMQHVTEEHRLRLGIGIAAHPEPFVTGCSLRLSSLYLRVSKSRGSQKGPHSATTLVMRILKRASNFCSLQSVLPLSGLLSLVWDVG